MEAQRREIGHAASVRRNHWWNAPFHLTAAASSKRAA
jgi:hypothetical protein